MRLLQNLLITNNARIFWKDYFWAGSLVIYQNGLESGKAVDVTSENVLYFNFWVSCLYTLNPLPSLLKWVVTLIATTYRDMKSRQSCRTTYTMRIKESERRPFFIFQMEYCFARFIPDRWNCDRNRRMETRSSMRLCQKL